MTGSLRVVVVDRCPVVAEGFRTVLTRHADISVVGIAHNAAGALREAALTSPDVVLLDLDLGADDGVELIATLARRCGYSAVLVVSDQVTRLVTAVKAGARGFLVKTSPLEEIAIAVHQVATGSTPVSPLLLPSLLSEVHDPRDRRALSDRELEVLGLVAEGRTNAEIAKAIFLSETTVKTHLRRIFGKLQVTDRASAVATAIAAGGLVPVDLTRVPVTPPSVSRSANGQESPRRSKMHHYTTASGRSTPQYVTNDERHGGGPAPVEV